MSKRLVRLNNLRVDELAVRLIVLGWVGQSVQVLVSDILHKATSGCLASEKYVLNVTRNIIVTFAIWAGTQFLKVAPRVPDHVASVAFQELVLVKIIHEFGNGSREDPDKPVGHL